LASVLFAELTHNIGHVSKRLIRTAHICGLLTWLLGSRDYLGLAL